MSIWDLAKPVIAQVHGYCLAGASELATGVTTKEIGLWFSQPVDPAAPRRTREHYSERLLVPPSIVAQAYRYNITSA